jgi:hypothetical protein
MFGGATERGTEVHDRNRWLRTCRGVRLLEQHRRHIALAASRRGVAASTV